MLNILNISQNIIKLGHLDFPLETNSSQALDPIEHSF